MSSPLMALPDHLLTEIFLRLPAPEDLARASATCVSFHRLATDGSFLGRFRPLHAPPLLAFFDHEGFHLAVPPHPSAPAARALFLAADFSFSFLPSHCRWDVRDILDGRVLLDRAPERGENPTFTELAVCDPVHRRYILLPPVPDYLAASVDDPAPINFSGRLCEPSLIPPSQEEAAAEETAFRVIWLARSKIKLSILIFSSSTRQWRAAASQGLRDLLLGKGNSPIISPVYPMFLGRHYACGCVYWRWVTNDRWNELLVLDTRTMEFSIADLPRGGWNMVDIAIMEVGEDKLGLFDIRDGATDDLCYTIGPNQGEDFSRWQMEKTISLGSRYRHLIGAATGRYLLLEGSRKEAPSYEHFSLDEPDVQYFSLDIKKLQLERGWGKPILSGTSRTHLYTNFPPSLLSSPTI